MYVHCLTAEGGSAAAAGGGGDAPSEAADSADKKNGEQDVKPDVKPTRTLMVTRRVPGTGRVDGEGGIASAD